MDSIEYVKKAASGEIDIAESIKDAIENIKKIDKENNYFLHIAEKEAMQDADLLKSKKKKGRLYGLPISVKDCICVKGVESRAGSRILEGYRPVFDATVIERIKEEGGVIIGKTSQDAFGFGSFNANVGIGDKIPKNPYDKERVTGGSSGGAAGITRKIEVPHIAISESTGGSIACPAAYCGVYGFTPTYGRVSRYGLMDYANSMDKIGVMSKGIDECALMLEIISGYDEKDSTSSNRKPERYTEKKTSAFKVALVKESLGKGVDKNVKDNLNKKLAGVKHGIVELPITFRYGIEAYYLISMSEASTNLAKYCGMRYGKQEEMKGDFNEYFSKIRSSYFSKEEKRRIIIGTFARMSGFRDAFYLKALRVRTKIIEEYKKAFSEYDILITPTMPNIAPRLADIKKLTPLENYMMDIMTVGPNIAGLPHINIPTGFSGGMPTGILAVANHFEEHKLVDFARWLK